MILLDLRNYLQQRGQVSLQELIRHFQMEPAPLRGMLEMMIRKGEIRREIFSNSKCGNCNKCDTTALEIYHWCVAKT